MSFNFITSELWELTRLSFSPYTYMYIHALAHTHTHTHAHAHTHTCTHTHTHTHTHAHTHTHSDKEEETLEELSSRATSRMTSGTSRRSRAPTAMGMTTIAEEGSVAPGSQP